MILKQKLQKLVSFSVGPFAYSAHADRVTIMPVTLCWGLRNIPSCSPPNDNPLGTVAEKQEAGRVSL